MEKFGADGRLVPDEARQIIMRIGIRAGFRLHPHLLRKTVATQALRRGMPIEEVRVMLGHESISTTTIYAQTQQDAVKQSHKKYV
ncbi:MAG: tyrosine-type recombinase/integrase [bacterium]